MVMVALAHFKAALNAASVAGVAVTSVAMSREGR